MKSTRYMLGVTVNADYCSGAMHPNDDGPHEAAARLMEYAPEMLAMLQRLIHPMADDVDVDDARELIAVVRGYRLENAGDAE